MRRWRWPALAAGLVFAAAILALTLGKGIVMAPATSSPAEPTPAEGLLRAGDTVTIQARDAAGTWGTVTLVRGRDTGGYPTDAIDPGSFTVEVFVTYEVDRAPTAGVFGRGDWALVFADDGAPAGRPFRPAMPPDPADIDVTRLEIGEYESVAVDWSGETLSGALFFEVPREDSVRALQLVYRPAGAAHALFSVPVRAAGHPPAPVATATPVPTPGPVQYVVREGASFTVIDSPAADELFAAPESCTNALGHVVAYPAAWHHEQCTWFGPHPFDVSDPLSTLADAVIEMQVVDGAFGSFNTPEVWLQEQVEFAGWQGRRLEIVGTHYEGGGFEAHPAIYQYSATFGGPGDEAPSLRAVTDSARVDDYDLAKAVLDRMIASLRLADE